MRPWRLTRHERVEMEWALAGLRGEVLTRVRDRRIEDVVLCAAAAAMGARGHLAAGERILRARVALALRAALRADEDARCEERVERVHAVYDAADFERSELRAGAEDWCDSLREWPPLAARREGPAVPLVALHPHLADRQWARDMTTRGRLVALALWEVAR